MVYKFILFDVDDTLFDSISAHKTVFATICRHFKLNNTLENYNLFISINDRLWEQFNQGKISLEYLLLERYRMLFYILGVNHNPVEANDIHLKVYAENMHLLPHALETISYLSKRSNIYLITNAVASVHHERMRNSPLSQYVNGSFISQEIGYQKPSQQFFDHVYSHIPEITKSNSLVVGDSLSSDILGSMKYGLDCCWFNPNNKALPTDMNVTYEIKDLLELKKIIF